MQRPLAAFALAVLYVALPVPAPAQDEAKESRAVVQEIDTATGTITVILTEGRKNRAARVRTFNLLKPDLPVTDATDKVRKLTDLQPDDRVMLKVVDDDVVAIRLAPPLLYGTLTRVDPQERALVIRTRIGDKSVTVPAAAPVYDRNEPARFEDLKAGLVVYVALADDQKTVLEVRAGKTPLPVAKLTKGTGYLIDIDRDRPAVQILVHAHAGDISLLRDLPVAKDATFGLLHDGRPLRDVALDELSRGVKVYYWTDSATRKLAHLGVELPVLGRRVVKALDRERRQLTLEDPEGDKVLRVAPHVKVLTARGPGALAQVRPQAVVRCALSPDRRTAEVIHVVAD